jgi:GntR family transcriptional regulator
MLWRIDRADQAALHEQLAASVRRAISDGTLEPGERLPPARDVATIVGVNQNTVLQAYRSLRSEGLVEFQRGRGVRVTRSATPAAPVTDAALLLLTAARRHGYAHRELLDLLTALARRDAGGPKEAT